MATGSPTRASHPTEHLLKAGEPRTDDLKVRRRTTPGRRARLARITTAAGIAACLSSGVAFTAEASPARNTDPGLELLEDTVDTLGDRDDTTDDMLDAGPGPRTPADEVAQTNTSDTSPLPMIAVAVIAAAGFALASYAMLSGRRSEQIAEIAFTDGLTGLKNRRRLDADIAAQRERGERATATLMIDVDHFKSFNDTHGHAMGDEVLRLVGEALRQEFRRTDVPYRYGGEEFCVLLNDVTPGEAVSAGERARAAVSAVALPIPEPVTVSIGVSIGSAEHLGDTIKRADGALHDAKAAGRDRVNFAAS